MRLLLQKHEIDVVYKKASQLIPIEIKSSQTFNKIFMKELDYFSTLFPEQCEKGYIVYAGESSQKLGWRTLMHYQDVSQITEK